MPLQKCLNFVLSLSQILSKQYNERNTKETPMRQFTSYGPIDTDDHYYAPRTELIQYAMNQLIGNPEKGGHYITIWAPRQTGKTWVMQQVVKKIYEKDDFEVAIISLQSINNAANESDMFELLTKKLKIAFKCEFPDIQKWAHFSELFSKKYFNKPVIIILDEFDALDEVYINKFANEFREMYIGRKNEILSKSSEKSCILHGLALIGVRSVLGIENVKGSPFNVQRSVHIPNLTFDEVNHLYQWYQKDTNQQIDSDVIYRIYYEFNGQPGLTCWFGELLTDIYNTDKDKPITMNSSEEVFYNASEVLPNNNILNIISKARQKPYQEIILTLFQTGMKIPFKFDNMDVNFLYMNGIIDLEKEGIKKFIKFSSPFVQQRLFNYFTDEFFRFPGQLVEPFKSIENVINENDLNVKNLLRLYETYLKKNRHWLLKNAPRRKDLKIFEAVYHFNLYMYLDKFLSPKKAKVWPEFPTGNGKIDIIIKYLNKTYGIELKTYSDESSYKKAIKKAVHYAKQLQIKKTALVFFVENIDDENRKKYEQNHLDNDTNIIVETIFIECGS
jgi:hypothetical protein